MLPSVSERSKRPRGPRTLRLRVDCYKALVQDRGWTTLDEQAKGLELGVATVSRLRSNSQGLGSDTIAALLHAFGVQTFPDLFEIVPVTPPTDSLKEAS